ncbi:MAG: EAL domain-containing protein [Selenomonadaceae bacterium]|nr:EAL domain-containing protein [Selenomonadaceae bacterium]
MARSLNIFLITLTIIFLTFSVQCEAEPSNTGDTAAEDKKQNEVTASESISQGELETFKVGYIKHTGFLFEDLPGHKTGYGFEYMEFLSNYVHCNFEYVEAKDWDDLVSKLQKGEVDIIPDMPGDYKKVQNVIRTEHVVGRYPMELVTKGVKPHMKLGTVPFLHSTPTLPKVAQAEGFTYETVSYPNLSALHKAFHDEDIDGYVDAMVDPRRTQNVLAMFDRQSYRLLIRADRKEFYNRVNLAMENLLLYQPNIRDRLNATYFVAGGFPLTLSRSEEEYLKQKKKLKTAVFSSYQPYAYRDENDNLVGVIPSIVKRISEDLGVEVEIVETKDFYEAGKLIEKGEIDFIADVVCDYSWAESLNMKPTKPYLSIDYVPVTRMNYNIDPSTPMTIACVKDIFYTTHFIEPHFPESQRVYVSSLIDALQAVNDGLADVTYVQRNAVHSLIEEAETYTLEVKSASVYAEPVSLGVYVNSDEHLWQILDKEIGHMRPDWIRDLVNTNQKTITHFSLKWALYHHPIRSIGIFALFGALVWAFLIYRGRMRQQRLELVEHMAYTDLRYELPNVPWLEREVPVVIESLEQNMKTFFVVFSMASSAAVTATQGHRLVDKQFKTLAQNLNHADPVLLVAAGIDVDHLICFCKAENLEKITEWVHGIIESNSYMETAAESTKIVLHTRAGIAPYEKSFSVQQAVDRALVACHQPNGDVIKVFDEKLQDQLTTNHNIEGRMEQALSDGEFKAWYQPKYDIRTREIIGAEALVRWISPELGFMPPGKFIPLFERNGFVIQVDYYLLEQTCKLQRQRLDEGKEVVPISVNQSRLHMTEEGYLQKMQMIVDTYKLPAGLIELEVTETMFGDFDAKAGQQNAEYIIRELHKMGFSVSVDDFGSGYSSFMMLGSLPMDVMKIDRSLLTGADKSPRMRDILRNVINLGHALEMKVLCEGIETKEQEDLLLELGCYYGQGFLNAKPMPVGDFIEFFERRNAEIREN